MQREWYERRLVSPIFEQPPLPRFPPGGRVDQRSIIGTKSGEGRQVVGADQDIDAVALVQGKPIDGFQPPRRRDPLPARHAKALGAKSDPARFEEGKLFRFRHAVPLAAFCPNTGPTSAAIAPAKISTQ